MGDRWGTVILSGGQGRRMGCVDKSGLRYKGKPFGDVIKEQLLGLDLPCYISRACYPGSRETENGLTVVRDAVKGAGGEWIGPMGGIWSCLHRTGLDGLFFVSCDMPLFRAYMARALLEQWEPGVDAVLWRTRDGRIQPMCGFYAASCMEVLERCIDQRNYRMMALFDGIRYKVVDTAEAHIPDAWFLNVNSPEVYGRLESDRIPVLAVSGRKDTGKTSLLEMLVKELGKAGVRAAVIKHDGHEFQADVPGTDSYRLKQAGAIGTAVYSATKYSITKEQPSMEAGDFFPFFREADVIFLEGQKDSDYPKLEVLRKEISCVPVCSPGTVLAYVWSGENGWGEERAPGAGQPVFSSSQKDGILESVVGFMDRVSLGDGGNGL